MSSPHGAQPAPTQATGVAAHHAPNGKFRNPWPDSGTPGLRDIVRVIVEFWKASRGAGPQPGMFPIAAPSIAYPRAPNGTATATWIGHSTALLQLGALNVITDPVFCQRAFPVQWMGPRRIMQPALPIEALPPLDVVLLSHNHYDHLDKDAVRRIARAHPAATWVVPLALGATIRRWGAKTIIELDWWDECTIGDLRVTATPAKHGSARGMFDRNHTLWCGYALNSPNGRVYFTGDTAYHPEFGAIGERCGPFDLVMIPIGAYEPRWIMKLVHVNPEESVRMYQDLVASHGDASHRDDSHRDDSHRDDSHRDVPLPLMLCIHWGTFRLTTEPFDEPPKRAVARWKEAGLDDDRLWVARFGETRSLLPPTGNERPTDTDE